MNDLIHWFASLDPFLSTLVSILAILGVTSPFLKKWYDRSRKLNKKLEAGMDSLLGYGPVLDPATGVVLKEATPSLAVRVDTIEGAIMSLAETQRMLADLHVRVEHVESWRDMHDKLHDSQ